MRPHGAFVFVFLQAQIKSACISHNSFLYIFNKTIIEFGFCDIRNNQGLGKCNQPRPPTSADYNCLDFDYSGYHKNLIRLLFIISSCKRCFRWSKLSCLPYQGFCEYKLKLLGSSNCSTDPFVVSL